MGSPRLTSKLRIIIPTSNHEVPLGLLAVLCPDAEDVDFLFLLLCLPFQVLGGAKHAFPGFLGFMTLSLKVPLPHCIAVECWLPG